MNFKKVLACANPELKYYFMILLKTLQTKILLRFNGYSSQKLKRLIIIIFINIIMQALLIFLVDVLSLLGHETCLQRNQFSYVPLLGLIRPVKFLRSTTKTLCTILRWEIEACHKQNKNPILGRTKWLENPYVTLDTSDINKGIN